MSKSPTIIDRETVGDPQDWLYNPHAGDVVASELMEPLTMSAGELAAAVGVDVRRLSDVISGARRIDAELDLRLARYFKMSPGFFLGLQVDHELLEARRHMNGELDRIVPRAA